MSDRGGPEGVQRGSRGGPEGVQRGYREGPEGVQRGYRGGPGGRGGAAAGALPTPPPPVQRKTFDNEATATRERVHRGSIGGPEGVHRGYRGGTEGIYRSSLDARKPQNPTKHEEYRRHLVQCVVQYMRGTNVQNASYQRCEHPGFLGAS
eukprot:9478321-Pyramimonas_sp.AAC.2